MGQSTNALLGWGVAFDEEMPYGIAYSDDDEPKHPTLYALEDELAAFGVVVESHCSGECTMPAVFIKESFAKAYRGHVVDVALREPGADWSERIEKALALLREKFTATEADKKAGWDGYDFSTDQTRGWKLVSWWC